MSNTLPPKCKACKGECVLWGEETDDSVDFSKITINPAPLTVPSDYIPWYEPYSPWRQIEPYTPPTVAPYLWPNITWCCNNTGCPNFGF
jgi:hypothetical protein